MKYAVEGLMGYPNELAHKLDEALEMKALLLEALKKIANPPVVLETDNAIDVISWAAYTAQQAITKAEEK